jgi:rhodanese-related sulfurtransferase
MKTWIRLFFAFGVTIASAVAAAETELPLVSQQALVERQQASDAQLFVLDTRSPEEYSTGHVPGAINVPYDQVAERLAEIPRDKDVVLYCRSGRRAQIAAETLAENGYTRLLHLDGDMNAWEKNQRILETPADPAACIAALKNRSTAAMTACAPR